MFIQLFKWIFSFLHLLFTQIFKWISYFLYLLPQILSLSYHLLLLVSRVTYPSQIRSSSPVFPRTTEYLESSVYYPQEEEDFLETQYRSNLAQQLPDQYTPSRGTVSLTTQ